MSKSKGDRRERQAKEILEAVGYTVETPNSTPYPQPYGVDFFGVFDFMAFKDGEKPLFGQVKSNVARNIRSFSDNCNEMQVPFDNVDVEFWVCHDDDGSGNGGWRIIKISENGHETVFDERDLDVNMGEGAKEFKKRIEPL